MGPNFNFKHTIHDHSIYQTTFKGNKVLLLRMVDDLLVQCEHEDTTQEIFLLVGLALQLQNEDKPPFAYLGPCVDFNGVSIEESNTHIMISYQSYIDWMLCAHGWATPKSKQTKMFPLFPISVSRLSFKNVVLIEILLVHTRLNFHKVLDTILYLLR